MNEITPEQSDNDKGITQDEFRQSVAVILGARKPTSMKDMPVPTEEDLKRRYRIGGKVYVEEVKD